ncbi:MAG: hypothetical protein Q8934_07360 [Bacillota bacterium]|nr:hypothetical protein [Bacillota bacterium]
MPKFIPYLVLILMSVVLFILSWKKANDKKLIIFYLCMAGFVYYFEFTVLVVYKSYEYEPGLFKDPYIDNIFGANVSNGFIVPLATVFIAIFDLGIGWIILIVLCFLGIEELFLILHVYKHFWWKTLYTGIGLPIQFALGKWIWYLIRFQAKRFIVRLGTFYFANVTIQATFLYYISALFNMIYYRVNWFKEPTRGHIAFVSLFAFVDSLFFATVVTNRAPVFWQTILVLCGVGFNVMLFEWGVLEIRGYWAFAIIILAQVCYLFILKYFRQIVRQ